MPRPFRCPLVPLVPILGIAFCLLLMFSLPVENWLRLIIWLLIGFAIYFSYGRQHSALARMQTNITWPIPLRLNGERVSLKKR